MKGPKPKITLEQYRRIREVRNQPFGSAAKEITKLAAEFGLSRNTVNVTTYRGIKRYEYQIWKEGQS